MNTSRRARPAWVLVALFSLFLWSGPAEAADEIGLSADGVTWGPDLTLVMFGEADRWVPGDDETRTVQLRNQGPSVASVTVEALSPGGDPVLAADLGVSVRVDGGEWTPLELDAAPRPVTVTPLETSRAVPIDVRAVFDPAAGNPTQNRTTPLILRITLAGDATTAVGRDDAASAGNQLPGTGAVVGRELLTAAVALCAAGALLLARRSTDDDPAGATR